MLLLACVASGCDFKYDPVSPSQYYRLEGWYLPGVNDFNPKSKANLYAIPRLDGILGKVPNATARYLKHEDPYIVQMPSQVFTMNGKSQRMQPILAKAKIVRWEINGKVVAYSYSFIPVSEAHKINRKWIIKGESACVFEGTFIDDKGDGVFRILAPGRFTPDLIPEWVKPSPQS